MIIPTQQVSHEAISRLYLQRLGQSAPCPWTPAARARLLRVLASQLGGVAPTRQTCTRGHDDDSRWRSLASMPSVTHRCSRLVSRRRRLCIAPQPKRGRDREPFGLT